MIAAAAGWTGTLLGLVASLVLMVQGIRVQRRPDGGVRREHLRLAVFGLVAGAVIAMGALEVALLRDDFSVSYVAETSARDTPLIFKITTAWSALEGSLVLWALVLSGYTAVVLRQVRSVGDRLGTGALAVMGGVSAFFFGMLLTVANPFGIIANPPLDGPGPNPILQNHLMVVFHPPMLYLGFVGFTVPFAFAISALVLREGGVDWLRRTRRSNLVAWSFLTGGLVYGAWWSYEVLGWGGYWAWDPVENAALIPWLLATAFIHSSVVQLKRGMLQAWNFVLVLATYSMTILGTFLTRSSVITSVHSFSQSAVGPVLLGFFVLVLVGGLLLFAFRGDQLASGRKAEHLASREGVFLLNNLLFTLFAFVVLLGTLYPVVLEALTGAQTSVGRPFFDTMAVPLSLALLVAMGVGPYTPYRRASGKVMWRRLRIPLLISSVASAAFVVAGLRSPMVAVVLFLVTAIVAGAARELVTSAPALRPGPILRLLRTHRGYWGGQISHIGLALMALAIALSGGLTERKDVTLEVGESTQFAGYTLTYEGAHTHERPDRTSRAARIVLEEDGKVVRVAEPALTQFQNATQAVGTPSVWTRPTQDIYVALSSIESGQVSLNIYRFPFMWLLWAGGSIVMLGGFWALWGRPRRRRRPEGDRGQDRLAEVSADG